MDKQLSQLNALVRDYSIEMFKINEQFDELNLKARQKQDNKILNKIRSLLKLERK